MLYSKYTPAIVFFIVPLGGNTVTPSLPMQMQRAYYSLIGVCALLRFGRVCNQHVALAIPLEKARQNIRIRHISLYSIEVGGEIYVGFTSKSIEERIQQHIEKAKKVALSHYIKNCVSSDITVTITGHV